MKGEKRKATLEKIRRIAFGLVIVITVKIGLCIDTAGYTSVCELSQL